MKFVHAQKISDCRLLFKCCNMCVNPILNFFCILFMVKARKAKKLKILVVNTLTVVNTHIFVVNTPDYVLFD